MEVLDLAGGIGLVVGVTSACASAITGEVVHVDAGFHVEGMVFH
jgi:enoyl-[acyl-carrier-protein] reductase (NADH)